MRLWCPALIFAAVAGVRVQFPPPDLPGLVQAEQAFASAARASGWRAAFLEFFADDAVTFAPEPVLVRPRLASAPNRRPDVEELVWEPRAGDASASGDLGWLTGPSAFVDHSTGAPPQYGNYLSIWKRASDGRWRVYIDVGTKTPGPVPFATGFTQVTVDRRYSGAADAAGAKHSLLAADESLNEAIGRIGAPAAYSSVAGVRARLHRNGTNTQPAVGVRDIARWLSDHTPTFAAVTKGGEPSGAGDLGYTFGQYTSATAPLRGAYVRIWTRQSDGLWRLQVDALVPLG